MTDGTAEPKLQSDLWREFYENAWQARLTYLTQLIEEGETDPLRCLQRLFALERKHSLHMDVATRQVTWDRLPVDRNKLLPSGVETSRVASGLGKFVEVPAYTNSSIPEFLVDFIHERGPFDAVIELGCGIGRRIIELHYYGAPRDTKLFGGEMTQSGVATAQRLAALNPNIQAEFFPFDHVKPDLAPIRQRGFGNVLVFTSHSIEQVAYLPQEFFQEVAGCARQVTCVHLEPFGFQAKCDSDQARAQRAGFEKNQWNQNLFAAAAIAEQKGVITREWVSIGNFLSTDYLNSTSILIWRSRAQA
jgi:SAM-dependent methyltransferase